MGYADFNFLTLFALVSLKSTRVVAKDSNILQYLNLLTYTTMIIFAITSHTHTNDCPSQIN